MSVTYGVEFVDWKSFKALWQRHGEPSFFHEAEEVGADWIVKIGPQPRWDGNWYATIAFSDAFKQARSFLDAAQRKRFEAFLSGFCLTDDKHAFHPPRDLGADIGEEVFYSTIAPATVRHYLALWEKLDLEALRPAYEQITPPPSDVYVRTFERFKQQPEMWADLLRDAVAKKAGIVITAA